MVEKSKYCVVKTKSSMAKSVSSTSGQGPSLFHNPGGTPSLDESEIPIRRPLLRDIKQTQANTLTSEFGDKIVDTRPPIKKYCTTLLPPIKKYCTTLLQPIKKYCTTLLWQNFRVSGSFFETKLGAEKAIIMAHTSETNSDTYPVGVTSRHTPSICNVCKKRPFAFNLKSCGHDTFCFKCIFGLENCPLFTKAITRWEPLSQKSHIPPVLHELDGVTIEDSDAVGKEEDDLGIQLWLQIMYLTREVYDEFQWGSWKMRPTNSKCPSHLIMCFHLPNT